MARGCHYHSRKCQPSRLHTRLGELIDDPVRRRALSRNLLVLMQRSDSPQNDYGGERFSDACRPAIVGDALGRGMPSVFRFARSRHDCRKHQEGRHSPTSNGRAPGRMAATLRPSQAELKRTADTEDQFQDQQACSARDRLQAELKCTADAQLSNAAATAAGDRAARVEERTFEIRKLLRHPRAGV